MWGGCRRQEFNHVPLVTTIEPARRTMSVMNAAALMVVLGLVGKVVGEAELFQQCAFIECFLLLINS